MRASRRTPGIMCCRIRSYRDPMGLPGLCCAAPTFGSDAAAALGIRFRVWALGFRLSLL